MKADLVAALADERPAVGHEDLDDLLDIFGFVAGTKALASLRRSLSEQVLRAIEISLLSDSVVIDVALNVELYLGREWDILSSRLSEILGAQAPPTLVRHVRALALSKAAGASRKAPLGSHEVEVLRRHRAAAAELRCSYCGYQFVQADLGQTRLDYARELGFGLADEKLARRLRDPWKPAAKSALTIDHVIPEAGLGPTEPENLRVTCQFCNTEKRIYRWAGEAGPRDVAAALLSLGDISRGLWAARATTYVAILASGGGCSDCGRTVGDAELTGRPLARRGASATAPWAMTAACYECYDPAAQ
jgi:hypothetical protein